MHIASSCSVFVCHVKELPMEKGSLFCGVFCGTPWKCSGHGSYFISSWGSRWLVRTCEGDFDGTTSLDSSWRLFALISLIVSAPRGSAAPAGPAPSSRASTRKASLDSDVCFLLFLCFPLFPSVPPRSICKYDLDYSVKHEGGGPGHGGSAGSTPLSVRFLCALCLAEKNERAQSTRCILSVGLGVIHMAMCGTWSTRLLLIPRAPSCSLEFLSHKPRVICFLRSSLSSSSSSASSSSSSSTQRRSPREGGPRSRGPAASVLCELSLSLSLFLSLSSLLGTAAGSRPRGGWTGPDRRSKIRGSRHERGC